MKSLSLKRHNQEDDRKYRAGNGEGQDFQRQTMSPLVVTDKNIAESRSIFFDNLRYLFVLFVVLEHSGHAYDGLDWWPVSERNVSVAAEWLTVFSYAFTMPLLFFIAGCFALPTIQKKGTIKFIIGKFRRLGIPWIVCILTICPILPLIYHYTRNGFALSQGYWDLWVLLLKRAAEFNTGIIGSMNALMQSNQFYQRYMWFLSLLIAFFLIFAGIYALKKSWFTVSDRSIEPRPATVSSTLKLLFAVGLLTFFCSLATIVAMFALTPGLSNPEPLFTLGNVIQFWPSRFFMFAIYFGLGIVVFKKKWIENGRFSGHLPTWASSFFVLLIGYIAVFHLLRHGPGDKEILGPLFVLLMNLLCISTLGLFASIAIRWWNRPRPLDRSLAANSYNIYLSHYIFVIVLQLALLDVTAISSGLKFGLVTAASILCSYLASRFLITPYPKLSIGAAFTLLIFMFVFVNP
jgi:glucans biosynthesis protein C